MVRQYGATPAGRSMPGYRRSRTHAGLGFGVAGLTPGLAVLTAGLATTAGDT